jgi:hypothetical protein
MSEAVAMTGRTGGCDISGRQISASAGSSARRWGRRATGISASMDLLWRRAEWLAWSTRGLG